MPNLVFFVVVKDENPALTTIRPTQDMTPHKFSCPHVIARFSPGGILLRVLPNSPKDGVAAHIELHDLNVLLGDLPTAQEMKFFPGKSSVFIGKEMLNIIYVSLLLIVA